MAIGPTTEAKRSRKGTGNEADLQTAAQEDLKSDLAYLQQQVHGLRSRFHGELGVLALRIEDNERRTMKRRKVARRWVMAAVVAVCLWLGSKGVRSMLDGPFLLPGLALVGLTLLGGITLLLLQPAQRCRRAGTPRPASQLVSVNCSGGPIAMKLVPSVVRVRHHGRGVLGGNDR